MRYLILGGAGIFAIHTAKYLLSKDETTQVVSVGRNRERSEAFTLGIGKNDSRYSYKQIHITFETDVLFELIDKVKPNYIINFAALAYATSWEKSFRYYDTNIMALSKLCEFLNNKDYLDKFLQIGSSEIYGSTVKPAKENDIFNPTSPYAVSKLCGDLHLKTLYYHNKFPMNIIRPSNCYGSGQLMYRVIPKTALYLLKGRKFPLEGGGIAKKSFMHASDLATAIYLILHKAKSGEVYNAGVDHPTTIRNLVEITAEILGLKFDDSVEITAGRKTEDNQYWIDSSKIKNELGWNANINLRQGIEETVNWVKDNQIELSKEDEFFTLRA